MMRARFTALLLLLKAVAAQGHPAPHSSIQLDIQKAEANVELRLPLEQLEIAFGRRLQDAPRESVARFQSELKSYITQHLKAQSSDTTPWPLVFDGELTASENETPVDLIAKLKLLPPPNTSTRNFTLESDLIQHQIVSHKIFVVLKSDWEAGAVSSAEPKVLDVLRYLHNSLVIDLGPGSTWKGFMGTFRMGMRHIAEGTDHLLFLFMLLLPSPLLAAGGRWGGFAGTKPSLLRLLSVVTAFTIGHSLTLAVGAFGWLRLPSAPVEALIALSVFISAVHALRPLFPHREFWIAAGFGLIHGLAFSSAAAEFGLGAKQLVISVLGFNLGIEFMQLSLVAVVVPGLLILNKTSWYHWVRVPCSLAGLVAASIWLAERL